MCVASSDRQPVVQIQLSVRRGREAIEFYKAAFGAEEIYRFGGTDDHEDVVCQLSANGAPFGWRTSRRPTGTSALRRSRARPSASC